MKKQILVLIIIALLPSGTYSQCTPDTVNCKDVLTPGQICPEELADGYLGLNYSQTVTILPPPSFVINNVGVTIVKIKIDTVTNLPPGLSYQVSAEELYPGTAYCVLVSGIPTQTGLYMLNISVIPYIMILDNVVELPPVENDTSVRMTIYESNAVNDPTDESFHAIESRPNPFSATTEIGFTADEYASITLKIHNNLGLLLYTETIQAKPGRNFFGFNGEDLSPGYYIYSIVNNRAVFSEKMIKSR